MNKFTITDLKTVDMKHYDLFIGFCSFEKRCLSIIKAIDSDKVEKGLVFINNEAAPEAIVLKDQFEDVLRDKIEVVPLSVFNPIELADSMLESIKLNTAGVAAPRVLVDITSFTHEALLIFMAITNRFYKNAIIDYAYCNASTYASESGENGEQWLSRGIREVRSVLGFAGDIKPSQETVLIMMVGYECERAWQVIDSISPEELIITYNDASGSTDQTNGDANQNHAVLLKDLAAYYQNPEQCIIPSNNPFKTATKLEEVIDNIGEGKNIIVAPMNNKLSTVGAGIVALKRPDIQLCYAPAIYYNTSSYSVEGDMCYLFSLDELKEK